MRQQRAFAVIPCCIDIHDGDVIIFLRSGFDYVEHNKVVVCVIEKIGEEEGFGAWSLKRLVIEQPATVLQPKRTRRRD